MTIEMIDQVIYICALQPICDTYQECDEAWIRPILPLSVMHFCDFVSCKSSIDLDYQNRKTNTVQLIKNN